MVAPSWGSLFFILQNSRTLLCLTARLLPLYTTVWLTLNLMGPEDTYTYGCLHLIHWHTSAEPKNSATHVYFQDCSKLKNYHRGNSSGITIKTKETMQLTLYFPYKWKKLFQWILLCKGTIPIHQCKNTRAQRNNTAQHLSSNRRVLQK